MKGEQQSVYEALSQILVGVKEGRYGADDDFDSVSFDEDIYELLDNMNP